MVKRPEGQKGFVVQAQRWVDERTFMPQVAEGWKTQYVLFAREGFTEALREEARAKKALLVSLNQLEQTLSGN